MNARARRGREIIRQQRRARRQERERARARAYVIERRHRSLEAQRAAGLFPFPPMQEAARRIEALFRHYSICDGIAYVPTSEIPPPGQHTEILGPTGSGKTLPINAAYWIGEDVEADAPRDPVELQERITAGDVDQEDEDSDH